MQINSISNISEQYLSALQSKQKESSTGSFEDEITKKALTNTVETTSQTQKIEVPQERYHEVLTYKNTKGMTNEEIDEYFSERSEEERNHIKLMVNVSNNFSEDDIANEAVFIEAKSKVSIRSQQEFYMQLAFETMDYSLGAPTLSNVLRVSDEWVAATDAGIVNTQELGIFMNAAEKARYENGVKSTNYNKTKLTSEEASDFLSTMLNLAQRRMEQARGTAVFDDYKEAFERYQRLTDNYNSLLANKEEDTTVDIQA